MGDRINCCETYLQGGEATRQRGEDTEGSGSAGRRGSTRALEAAGEVAEAEKVGRGGGGRGRGGVATGIVATGIENIVKILGLKLKKLKGKIGRWWAEGTELTFICTGEKWQSRHTVAGRQAQGVTEVAVGSHGYVVARVGTTAKEGRVGGR